MSALRITALAATLGALAAIAAAPRTPILAFDLPLGCCMPAGPNSICLPGALVVMSEGRFDVLGASQTEYSMTLAAGMGPMTSRMETLHAVRTVLRGEHIDSARARVGIVADKDRPYGAVFDELRVLQAEGYGHVGLMMVEYPDD